MATRDWGKLVEEGLDRVELRAKEKIRNGIDAVDRAFSGEAADDEDEDDDEDEGDDDSEEASGTAEDDDAASSISFDLTGPDGPQRNKELAVAAYRVWGVDGDFVAWHPSGTAFFGDMSEFTAFVSNRDMDDEKWRMQDEPAKILDMDYEASDVAALVQNDDGSSAADEPQRNGRRTTRASQAEVFKALHWGDEASTRTMIDLQGISTPLVQFGVARYSEYFARKGGEETEFWHQHGEESGVFPLIFVPQRHAEAGYQWYIVAAAPGSKFRVDVDGIHD